MATLTYEDENGQIVNIKVEISGTGIVSYPEQEGPTDGQSL